MACPGSGACGNLFGRLHPPSAKSARFPMNNPRLLLTTTVLAFTLPAVQAQQPEPMLTPPELTEQWWPVPPVVSAPAGGVPSDAIVLFDGQSLAAWESVKTPGAPAPWKVEDGAMVVVPKAGNIQTKAGFGDVQLHLEFRSPAVVKGRGQGRGNSGLFFMQRYELQILDSYENKTYVNGQLGSVYKQQAPLVNPARPPGEWQSYDVIFTAPRFKADGSLESPARLTAFLNGVLVQNNTVLTGPTEFRGAPQYKAHPARLPIALQDHGDLVAFRNIWVREL